MTTDTDSALMALWRYAGNTPPSVLYHYTSMAGLLSIIETGRIRATHIRYLNDRSEAETMWAFVLKRLQERMGSAKSIEEGEFLSEIVGLAQKKRLPFQFVASFSESGDDLTQWRAYCPGEAGFSIGFSSAALRSQWVSDPEGGKPSFVGGQLVKIRYVNDDDYSEIDLAIDDTIQIARQLHGAMGFRGPVSKEQVALAWFTTIAPTYKNSVYGSEREWRMLLTKPHKPMPGQRFRAGKSTVIPDVEIELDRDAEFKRSSEYMIREVFVGPTPNPDLAVEAIQQLFLSKGHREVVVAKSAVPHRHW